MKRYLLLFSLLLASLVSGSQTVKYDLSKYKLPDIKRHQMDLNVNSQGRNLSSQYYYEYENQTDTFKRRENTFRGVGNLSYSFYRNSEKIQSDINSILYGYYSKADYNNPSFGNDQTDFNSFLYFKYDVKYFLTPANWFINVVPKIETSYNHYNQYTSGSEYENLNASPAIGIGGGKGRIEQVQDLRHAILLVEEFQKRGVSKGVLTEQEILEFASLISELKNQRFFDARKQKEKELVALDSFLVEKGIVEDKNILYYAGLEDIWSYGGLQTRESGKQLFFSVTPDYNYLKNLYTTENNISEDWSLFYNLAYISKKPLSVKWQTDYYLGIIHRSTYRLRQQYEGIPEQSFFSEIYLNSQIGYYPNTRTNFNVSGKLNLANNSEEKILDEENYGLRFIFSTSGYYYISEKLRLGYSIQYDILKGVFSSETQNNYEKYLNYNINLNYAIF